MNDDIEPTAENIAAQLYTAYCAATNHKAFNGDPLPFWDEFAADPKKQVQVKAWTAAAQKAIDLFTTP